MFSGDVADFMTYYTGELRFVVRDFQQTRVEVDKAAHCGEGIHLIVIHDLEGVGEIGALALCGETLTDLVHVVGHGLIA